MLLIPLLAALASGANAQRIGTASPRFAADFNRGSYDRSFFSSFFYRASPCSFTVEERRFQRRVKRAPSIGLKPVNFLGGLRGAEAPLFHVIWPLFRDLCPVFHTPTLFHVSYPLFLVGLDSWFTRRTRGPSTTPSLTLRLRSG